MDRTAQMLFEYLRDILFYPSRAFLDKEQLPEDFQKLGEGLQFLEECVREEREFERAMARGDLSLEPPAVENPLTGPMKELQGSLRHLAWQTRQVAKGDYSQRVDFMGEFSEAFNTMTEQLKEHQEALLEEKNKIEEKNEELKKNLDLVLALTNYTHNMIFVFSEKKQIFVNESAEWAVKTNPDTAGRLQKILMERKTDPFQQSETWSVTVPKDRANREIYYEIESFPIYWMDQLAIVHIVIDNTERKKKEDLMYRLAYVDPLTGLNNRRYAWEVMEVWIDQGIPFCLTFLDLDYLKLCNDTYGHEKGDKYLIEAAKALKALGDEVCRIGGDEFMVLHKGVTAVEQDRKLESLRSMFREEGAEGPYPMGFSYATSEVPAFPEKSLDEYVRDADSRMYQYKQRHKKPLEDLLG